MTAEPDTAVDVAQAAALTDLTPAAIRSRIRRGSLTSATRDGRRWIPVSELQRLDLVHTERRYRSLRERVNDLERRLRIAEAERGQAVSELRAAAEASARAERECEELTQKLRIVTGAIRMQKLPAEQVSDEAEPKRWWQRRSHRRHSAAS